MAERKRARSKQAATKQAASRAVLSVDDVMQRAALAGIEIDADQWEMVTASMNQALQSLAALRPSEARAVEPAVRFEA
jgi:hypothetical protein